ncbi:MAG: helix-turn-helix transcriptional regulator [Verrucomicrobia bacterium]|nr:helix-turn-helix transcriptional regulator [Verrucomicrobiota bacterium]
MSRAAPRTSRHPSAASCVPDLDALAFRFVIAGSVKCGRGWQMPLERHPQHRLLVVRGGSGELLLGDHALPLRRGHIVFGLPGERYGIRQDQQKRLVYSIVRFEVCTAVRKPTALPRAFRPNLYSKVKCFPLLEELMLRLTNAVPTVPCWANGLSASLFRSALWLIREDHHSGDNLQAWNITHESLRPALHYEPPPGEREPSTKELARLCGMSSSTFTRRMHARFGASPKKVLLQKRMERAKILLLESPYKIDAIAADLGYKEPGHFTRQFKKWVGVSPSAFRTSDR